MSGIYQLPADIGAVTSPLADLALCEARLMNDARFVWVVLVPKRAGLIEIEDLEPGERTLLLDEVIEAGNRVRAMGVTLGRPVEKLNVGQLGNVTRPLHVHMIGRRADDAAWPRPVWGVGEAIPWTADDLARVTAAWSA